MSNNKEVALLQAGPQSEVFICTKFSMKVHTESKCTHCYFTIFLYNRIADNSVEIIPVMEKIHWGRLQEKLQEG